MCEKTHPGRLDWGRHGSRSDGAVVKASVSESRASSFEEMWGMAVAAHTDDGAAS
jgi:hypothetical protein